jgi:hypothetical protein
MSAGTAPVPVFPRPDDLPGVVSWIDAQARDRLGRRIGRVKAILADRDGRPWWLVLRRHGRTLLAPVARAEGGHGSVLLACTRAELEAAPDASGRMTPELQAALARHFGLPTMPSSIARVRGACPALRRRPRDRSPAS